MRNVLPKVALSVAVAATSVGTWAAVLEEVLVTAQKRTESLQDVPISVTAISGELIQDASIRNLGDLGAYVPNFAVTENAVNTIISMRGISVGAQQSFEQSVGMFVDGVHYGKSRQARLGLFDLEQVEVLRGPQGTLFGKNTLAGAINVRTASPKVGEGVSGRVAASFENDDGKYLEGYISGSLTDTFAMRLAVMDRQIDGYNDNTDPNAWGDKMPSTDETMYRIGAQWEPSDKATLAVRYTYSDYVREGDTGTVTTFKGLDTTFAPASNKAMYAIMGLAYPSFGPSTTDAYRDGYSIGGAALAGRSGEERKEGTDTQNEELSVNFEYQLDNGMTFTSVTGLSHYEYEDGIDADFLPVEFIGRSDDSKYDQFQQEIRLASDPAKRFSWVVGANYIDSSQEIDRLVNVNGSLGQPDLMRLVTCPAPQILGACGTPTFLAYSPGQLNAIGGPGLAAAFGTEGLTMFTDVGRLSRWSQDTESFALFGQLNYDITETLSITAGLRYTEETKTVDAGMDITTGATGITNPVPFDSGLAAALLHGLMGASFDSYAHQFNEERDTDHLLPAGSINWRPMDNHLLYVSYAEGFKSGGFNSVDDQNPVFTPEGAILRDQPGLGFEYDDETAWSIEVGGKHTLLDGAMRLNWNAFYSEYDDQQVSTFVGLGFVVTNAASTEIQGFEVDAAWQATDKLRFNLALGYVEGEYGEFNGAGCTAEQQIGLLKLQAGGFADGTSVNVAGRTCQQLFLGNGAPSGQAQDLSGVAIGAPEMSGSFGAEFVQPLGSVEWFTQLDVNFTDEYYMTGDLDSVDIQKGFEKVNLRTGLRGDGWMLMAYGRNIGDELTATGAADIPLAIGSHFQYRDRGEVYGIQVALEF